jgi:diguanylate cyclase (GGDEF)-like protein/PAS domain S-box-containing protein
MPPSCLKTIDKLPKITFHALLLVLLSPLLVSTVHGNIGQSDEILTPEERLWLANNQPRIVLAIETGYAPFVFLGADGQPVGLAYDYIRLIESKIGITFKRQEFSSLNDIFEAVRTGEVQIVNAVTPTPARLQFMRFTDPYISIPNVILVRKNRAGRMNEKALAGLKVSLVKSYAVTENLAGKNLGFSLDIVSDDLSALLNVSFGRADAAVIDLATASYLISQKGISNLRVAGEVELAVSLAIATPLSEPVLHGILQKGLAAITEAERAEIRKKWFNASGHSFLSDWRFWLVVGLGLLAVLAAIAAVFIWNRMLQRQVAIRTAELEEERSHLERRVSERTAELARSEAQLRATLDNTPNVAVQWYDDEGRVTYWNSASERLFGWKSEEALGKKLDDLIFSPELAVQFLQVLAQLRESGRSYGPFESEIHTRDGQQGWIMSTTFVIPTEDDRISFVCMDVDITERKKLEEKLTASAHYDALTHMPNRVLLADQLQQAMAQVHRRDLHLAVVFIDLDGFKAINDDYGHEVGDQLLMHVASRMKLTLREGDTLARLGGDEFVGVLIDLTDIDTLEPMLVRLLVAVAEPVCIEGLSLQVSASIGATVYPQKEAIDADQLLRQADQAMYQAKLAGKNRYFLFDPVLDNSIRCRHESLERIRRAVAEREFVLYYQPKVNMRTGAVIGAEALLRWQHPDEGLLPPARFLPVIEDHPLAVELGEWVIDTALSQIALWRRQGLDIPVSVNVSARHLQQADFVGRLRELLAAHPEIDPSWLEMEVLETSALEDIVKVSQIIRSCKEIGVMFALDDFGTGYSSLTYLKQLPVTLLKIDRSFIRDMLCNPDDLAILEGVMGLAEAFGREVIAEGVETAEQGEMLLQLGCELGQGFGIAFPMPASDFAGWASVWRTYPAWEHVPLVSRDDLPLLFAGVELCVWMKATENFIRRQCNEPPQLDDRQSRFSTWLKTKGAVRYGSLGCFRTVESLYRQLQGLAVELSELYACGQTAKAEAKLAELQILQEALLSRLKELLGYNFAERKE